MLSKRGKCLSAFGFAISLWLLLVSAATAQLTDATLKGTVRDSSGAVVAHASVAVTNQGTRQIRSTTTDPSGVFSLSNLPPGAYTVNVTGTGFKESEQRDLELNVGRTSEINVKLELGLIREKVEVTAESAQLPVSTEGRLSDTLQRNQITDLPLPQRDVFSLPSLSAGAVAIPGSAFSFKLSASPTVSVNGNRFRGNNYVLDGAMDTNTINTGEPGIVPSLESVDEVQVQTGNFSSEYGRGNGAVVNVRTKSGTNDFHGKAWEYARNAAVNARNYFATTTPPLVFNQFGANLGGPIIKNKTFFFASYEGSRNAIGRPLSFQVETPEFSNYVFNTYPSSIAASLLKKFPAPAPSPGSGGQKYEGEIDLTTPQGRVIPGLGTTNVNLNDVLRSDQYLGRLDHLFHDGKDTLTARWIAEYEGDNGATSSELATLGQAMRGFREPYSGYFTNLNVGEVHVFGHMVNDARFSLEDDTAGNHRPYSGYPQITIGGVSAPLGGLSYDSGNGVRSYEVRDTLSIDRGKHLLRAGMEVRKFLESIYTGPATSGTYSFDNLLDFAADQPFQQSLTVDPATGQPVPTDHYWTFYETGFFLQDDWKVSSRLTLNLGIRHDYFGTATERNGHMSSIIWGQGSTYDERLANASVGRVSQIFNPQKLNFSPRIGLAYDPFGNGKTSIRAGFSIAYQPPHGWSIFGQGADSPYAINATLQPDEGIGTSILYGIPVPFNPQFKTTLNAQGGVVTTPGEPAIRLSTWIVNPDYKTQYSESWFLNVQREFARGWIAEVGYVGTNGVNLERIDDINRFDGDLIVNNGDLKRINPNFGTMTYITNGASSSYNAMTAEVRHRVGSGLTLQANYRWSKWLDNNSDTSPHLATNDDPEGNPGPENEACLRCERGRSMFDIPQRFTASAIWSPRFFKGNGLLDKVASSWQISTIIAAQSGRPFDVWCSASFQAGCDFNADGGGNQFGGPADRPDAPAAGSVKSSFSNRDFVNGLFSPTIFPKPTPGTDGTLGRNVYRGPRNVNADLSLARDFRLGERRDLQFRLEAFNALNNVNLFLPNNDLALALKPDGTYSSTSSFGKSTRAFDPRILQASVRFAF